MKRYHLGLKTEIENPKIDAFIEEIIEVCQRHGFSIGHEDGHGSFEIYAWDNGFCDSWLRQAADGTVHLQAETTASSSPT